MKTTITEILGRAEQGMTRPFVCRGDDWLTYYVKGAYAGRRSLCCEWVANRLVSLVLPSAPLGVPLFTMAEVPDALIQGSARKDARDLGAGLVFASLRMAHGQELTWAAAQGWPEETMALLLLLDLWLQNEDRSLSALGGNPNLMVEQIPPLPDDDPEGPCGRISPGGKCSGPMISTWPLTKTSAGNGFSVLMCLARRCGSGRRDSVNGSSRVCGLPWIRYERSSLSCRWSGCMWMGTRVCLCNWTWRG